MRECILRDFPLFPLGIVALPTESVPLHIFEDRYRRMIEHCLAADPGSSERQFGIIWLSDQELKPVGCACEIERVLERMEDGRMNILALGTRPFRLLERQDDLLRGLGGFREGCLAARAGGQPGVDHAIGVWVQ